MSDTKTLLNRITAFRERLEQTPTLAVQSEPIEPGSLLALAARQTLQPESISSALRAIVGVSTDHEQATLPSQLTNRARKLIELARELVIQQRSINEDLFYLKLAQADPTQGVDPLVSYHRHTVAATESALRLAQAMPASAEHQLKVCEGIETLLQMIHNRLEISTRSLDIRRREWGRIERITRLLCDVQARRLVSFASFAEIAESLLDEAKQGLPMRFISLPAEPVARFVAAHALTAAQVMARIVAHDYEWSQQPVVAVATCLMMDIGLLAVPPSVLGKTTALEPGDYQGIEAHPVAGAKLLREVMPEIGPLADAIATHHERLDGTGYPKAFHGNAIPSLARLLAVVDTYSGLVCDRPHRPAYDPRIALTDTLLLAEQGQLDKDMAEYLVQLSFHPVGTIVELTDGRTAVVVSTHTGRVNLRATTRPVVAVLADAEGKLLAKPEFIDLAGSEYGGLVRALSTTERKRILAAAHPDFCC